MAQDTPTPALKPQWLDRPAGAASIWAAASSRSDYQGAGGSSRNHSSSHDRGQSSRQSSSRRSSSSNGSRRYDRDGIAKSRDYTSFRTNRDQGRDFDSRDRESRSAVVDGDDFKSFGTYRSERDRMNRARSKDDTWSKGVVSQNKGSASRNNAVNSSISNEKSNIVASTRPFAVNSFSNAAMETFTSNASVKTSMNNTSVNKVASNASNTASITFEREFPELISEDKNGRQGISKVPSPSISTPFQNVPLISTADGWNSVLADLPSLGDPKKSLPTSSQLQIAPSKQTEVVPHSGTALSMAETLMQAPLRVTTRPQLSIEAQKVEERARRQLILRPLTPPASKSSVLSSSKTKGTRFGDPTGLNKTAQQLKIQSADGSIRGTVKDDILKLSQPGSFRILSREQNGTAHTTRDCPIKSVSPPPTPLVSTETQKKPVVSQKLRLGTNDRPLPLQGPCGDRKSNAKVKNIFFETLRTKSSNGSSSTAMESGSQQSSSSLVYVKQDSSNLENDLSLFPSEMKCTEHGKCYCKETNSSDGSQRDLSDTDENIPSLEPSVGDGMPRQLLVQSRQDLSEHVDTGDEGFQSSLSDSVEGSSSSTPADSDDGWNRSQSEPGDEDYTADISPEDKRFLIFLGWREDEIGQVEPLELDEIADTVKGCEELKKKLQSMESNDNIKSILLQINGQS